VTIPGMDREQPTDAPSLTRRQLADNLGAVLDRAMSGQHTYVTRHGRVHAAVVPADWPARMAELEARLRQNDHAGGQDRPDCG